ncbi:hypothetical protein [Spiroplasma citri]|uniref:hypothetical protein n=1 Tax=Spiroplasma citri TaxID=2133 RepID=UPI002478F294|nr:hypothetical protein [Spiroplasma citri]
MKKLLAYLGTVAIVGSGIPSVVAVVHSHKNIKLNIQLKIIFKILGLLQQEKQDLEKIDDLIILN